MQHVDRNLALGQSTCKGTARVALVTVFDRSAFFAGVSMNLMMFSRPLVECIFPSLIENACNGSHVFAASNIASANLLMFVMYKYVKNVLFTLHEKKQ